MQTPRQMALLSIATSLVPGRTSVRESHTLCDRIEQSIIGQLAKASVTIHVEPQEAHEPHGLPP